MIDYCANIRGKLAQLVTEVWLDSRPNLHAINIHAENFFRSFLNTLYGWKLVNANAAKANAAGVDLVYRANHMADSIVVQVSSSCDHEKLQSSLKKAAKDYPGAEFWFVAIQNSCPNYRKSFECCGLQFDPDTQILSMDRLYDDVVKKADIYRQKELSDLVDAYFTGIRQQEQWDLRPLGQEVGRSAFEYNMTDAAGNPAAPFVGRDAELEQLLRFVQDEEERPFRWWAVTAPGGAGKTRLAFELQNALLRAGGWDVAALHPSLLQREDLKLSELSNAYPGRTLLIADYVQQYTEELHGLLAQLSAPNLRRQSPLRLLLLERNVKDENGRYLWLEQIHRYDRRIQESCLPRKPLELEPLRPRQPEEEDPLLRLIRDFAKTLCAAGAKAERLLPLAAGWEKKVRDQLNSVDPELVRPLYAMMLTDAWLHNPDAPSWGPETLLDRITEREWDLAERELWPYREPLTPNQRDACRLLLALSTLLSVGGDTPLAQLEELLPWDWALLARAAEAHAAELDNREGAAPAAVLLTRAGLAYNGKAQPLRPDILGEFFVLRRLEEAPEKQRADFYDAALSKPAAAELFFTRALTDHPKLTVEELGRLAEEAEDCPPARALALTLLTQALFRASRRADQRRAIADLMERYLLRTGDGPEGLDPAWAEALLGASRVREALGAYGQALAACETALALRRESAAPEALAAALDQWSNINRLLARYPEAERAALEAISLREAAQREGEPPSAALGVSWCRLGALYLSLARYPEAMEAQRGALALLERDAENRGGEIAEVRSQIAAIHRERAEYKEALAQLEKALELRTRKYGADAPEVADTQNEFGLVYSDLGDYEKEGEAYGTALRIREAVLGKEHPETAKSLHNLGFVYQQKGLYKAALAYYQQALSILERVLGPAHPDTATGWYNLGCLYFDLGDRRAAREFLEKARRVKETVFGPAHPDTAEIWRRLGNISRAEGDYKRALDYGEKARRVTESIFGPQHLSTAVVLGDLAVTYLYKRDYITALDCGEKSRQIMETVLGPEHPNTAASWGNLATVYYKMKKYKPAMEYCEKARRVYEAVLGPEHPETATCWHNLGRLYLDWGRPAEAVFWLKKALAVREKVLPPEHPDTQSTRDWLRQAELDLRVQEGLAAGKDTPWQLAPLDGTAARLAAAARQEAQTKKPAAPAAKGKHRKKQ